jgi:hypothetical protein
MLIQLIGNYTEKIFSNKIFKYIDCYLILLFPSLCLICSVHWKYHKKRFCLRTFCLKGRFAWEGVFFLWAFFLRTFCPEELFSPTTFCLWTYCLRTFCLCSQFLPEIKRVSLKSSWNMKNLALDPGSPLYICSTLKLNISDLLIMWMLIW